jgi:hypothetical protein
MRRRARPRSGSSARAAGGQFRQPAMPGADV